LLAFFRAAAFSGIVFAPPTVSATASRVEDGRYVQNSSDEK
jgi:hypothetical protein